MSEEKDTEMHLSAAKTTEVEISKSVHMVEYKGETFCLTFAILQNSKLYNEEYNHFYKTLRVEELKQQFKLAGYYARIVKLCVLDRQNLHTTFRKQLKTFTELVISVNDLLTKFQRFCRCALESMQSGVEFSRDELLDDALENFANIKSSSTSMISCASDIQQMCSKEFSSFDELFTQTYTEKAQVSESVKKFHDDKSKVETERKAVKEKMTRIDQRKEKETNKIKDVMEKIKRAKSQIDEINLTFKKSISEVESSYKKQIDYLKSNQNEELIKAKERLTVAQSKNTEKYETMLTKTEQMFSRKVECAEKEFKYQSNTNQMEYDEKMKKEELEFKNKSDKINEEYKQALKKSEHDYSNDVKQCEEAFDKAFLDANMQYEKSIVNNKLFFEDEIKKNQKEHDDKVKIVQEKFDERRKHAFFGKKRIDQEETESIASIAYEKQQADENSESKCRDRDKQASIVKDAKLKTATEQKTASLQNAQTQKKFQDSDATNVKSSKENKVRTDLKIEQEHADKMKSEKQSLIKQSYSQEIENAKREREQLLAVAKNTQETLDNQTELEHKRTLAMQEEQIKKANEEHKSKIKDCTATYEKYLREKNREIEDLKNVQSEHESALKIIEEERATCKNKAGELTQQIDSLIGNLNNEESIEYCLQNAKSSIEYINATIQSISQFWKVVQDHCIGMETSPFYKRVPRLLKDQSNSKQKVFASNGFKTEIVTLMNQWTIINDICGVVGDDLFMLQRDFNRFITENPSTKESQDIIKELLKKIDQTYT